MPIVVTTPYNSYRKGATAAVIVKEVSGVSTGDEAQQACKINQYVTVHPEDSSLICGGWDAQCVSPDFFSVTFAFELKDHGGNVQRPTRISWDPGLSSEAFDRDVDGNPIVNSALDPFDDGTQIEIPDLFFSVIKSLRTPFDPQRAVNFMGTVNDGIVTIMGHKLLDGQCFCRHIGPIGDYTLTAKWIDVEHQFQMRQQGFDGRFLDQGKRGWHNERSPRGAPQPSLTEIFHPTGTAGSDGTPSPKPIPITTDIRLNGRGKPIEKSLVDNVNDPLVELASGPKGARVEKAPGGLAYFLNYKKYPRRKFQQMGL